MAYRRTHGVVRRLAARRAAILAAARAIAAESGMDAVQIAPVAERANIAAGTVYRYFPSKSELVAELVGEAAQAQLATVRRAASAAPGPLSALAATVMAIAAAALANRGFARTLITEPVDAVMATPTLASRQAIVGEVALRMDAAARAGHLPAQDFELTAAAVVGGLYEALAGPLGPAGLDEVARRREAVQNAALLALRAMGVVDARARGLVAQTRMDEPR